MKKGKYYDLLEKYENTLGKDGFGSPEYIEVRKELINVVGKIRRIEFERWMNTHENGKRAEEVVKKRVSKICGLFNKVLWCEPITIEDYAGTWAPCSLADVIVCFWDKLKALKRVSKAQKEN